MIRKAFSLILSLTLILCIFSGCTDSGNLSPDGILNIVCTTFPIYDWARNITDGAENVNIQLLIEGGTDLHSYQATAGDIVKIATADIFIYTGGDSDKWINDVLKITENDNTVLVDLMHNLPEESLFCVEAVGEENHHHEEEDEHDHNHLQDEHIWLSLKNAKLLTEIIKNVLCDTDSKNREIYEKNFRSFYKEIDLLDKSYEEAIRSCKGDTLVFADRFPFIYLTKDYGLTYFAAFSGCSSESDASFETVTRLAQKLDENQLSYILVKETSDGTVAETVKSCTKEKNQKILTLNALQSIKKGNSSVSYIEVMRENLDILKTALS